MGVTDSDIKQVTEAFVTICNKTGILDKVVPNSKGRSLAIKVLGGRFRTGFVLSDGTIRMLSDLDKPTVIVTVNKETYWDIINSPNPGIIRAKIYLGVYTEESIIFDPPPGVEGGALHMENLIKIFAALAESVMGG